MHDIFFLGGPPDIMSTYPHDGETRLEVIAPSMVTQEQLFRLFDIIPGLEFCDLDVQSSKCDIRCFPLKKIFQ